MRFRKIILSVLLVIAVLAAAFTLLAVFMGPRIKDMAVREMNRYLAVPVRTGDIDFSLIRKFPYASVSFTDVSTKGVLVEGNSQDLFHAGEIFLLFSWRDIFSDELRLKKISVQDASVFLCKGKDGKVNYDIFKQGGADDSRFAIELEDVLLRNTAVRYLDAAAGRDYSFFTSRLDCSGKFTSAVYDMHGRGAIHVERFTTGGINYLQGKETTVDLNILVDSGRDHFEVKESRISVAEMDLKLGGFLRQEKEGAVYDLKVSSEKAGLKELISLIPDRYTVRAQDFKYNGSVFFDLRIASHSGRVGSPVVTASFGTSGASLSPKGSPYEMRDIRFRGDFSSRPVERLQIRGISAVLEGQPLSGELFVEDFSYPAVRLKARAKIDLGVLSGFYMPDSVASMSGSMMVDASVNGFLSGKGGWTSSGTVAVKNADITLKGAQLPFSGVSGEVELSGNRLEVRALSGRRGASDFLINGRIENIYAFLFSGDHTLRADLDLESSRIDLGQLLDDGRVSPSDSASRIRFDPFLTAGFDFRVDELVFRRFKASSVSGSLSLRQGVLAGSGLSFSGFGGRVLLNGSIDARRSDSLLILCEADVNRLNIQELFYQMGNFGQEVIVDSNVKGKVTANVQFASTWSRDLHCNSDKVVARGKIKIEDGELNDFEPMLVLSRYLKSADLRRIRFETLQNEIEISGRTIRIPAMAIRSNVLDLTASGTHTFDNIVNYNLELYFSQVMGGKVRQNNTEFGTIEDDGLGRMRLFLSMKGPLSDPVIKVNRTAIEQKIVKEIKKEKQDIRKILHQEFGWFGKDSTAVSPRKVKDASAEELELDTSPEEDTP